MNERIRELMVQADYPAPEIALRAQKLAELIVRECLGQLFIGDPNEDFDKGIAWSAEQIRQHFGVEE